MMDINVGDVFFTAGAILGAFFVVVGILKQFLYICEPNEVLIFSGRSHKLPDGSERGYRILFGGRAIKIPLLEKVDHMDMTLMPVQVRVQNAYSNGGIPLNVEAIAHVKVSNEPEQIGNAIERFLGRDRGEIAQVARETLEGNLRGTLATLTPEEVNEDRLLFAKKLAEEVDDDLEKLGLHLDTLKVQRVEDDSNYLESIGRERIAAILRDAEIAESDAISEADVVAANAKSLGDVAFSNANAEIAQKKNELRKITADLEAEAKSSEEKAQAGALAARANAEAALQELRAKLEAIRLEADVVAPAEANLRAEEYRAKGEAAPIIATGHAQAEVSKLLSDAWIQAGGSAKDVFLIQQLEQILKTIVDRVGTLSVDKVNIVDSGDGRALPRYISAYPAAVSAVLKELQECTGIDVSAVLSTVQSSPSKLPPHQPSTQGRA